MTWKKMAVSLSLGVFLLTPAALAQEVVTDGFGVDTVSALNDAARTAVEEVSGAAVDSKTRVENGAVAADVIRSKAKGYIRSQEILSQDILNNQIHVRARFDVASHADKLKSEKPVVGIPAFTNKGIVSRGIDQEMLNQAADYANVYLLNTGKFDVVERSRVDALDDEFALTTGLSQKEAAELNQLTGTQYLLLGSINAMTTRRAGTNLVGLGTKKAKVKATVTVRLVDVETGQVVAAGLGKGGDDNTIFKLPFNILRTGTSGFDAGQVDTALEEAVADAISGRHGLIKQLKKNKVQLTK